MRILIVGGAGYIGSHVAHAFTDSGNEVGILDNYSTGSRTNTPKEAKVFEGDILNPSFMHRVLSIGWDGIVHLAAFKAAGESMKNPGKYASTNISGTINLLNAMVATGHFLIVFSSSAAIFGEPVRLPIDENHPTVPKNFYGFTKLEIERLLDWYDHLLELKFISLRYFNAAGYDLDERVTEAEKSPQNLIPILMETASGLRSEFTIYGDNYDTPDGTCIRDYIHVSDLAEAHVLALKHLIKHRTSLKLNLGSETGISVAQMHKKAMQIAQTEIKHIVGLPRKGDPAKLIASSELARKTLGWEATRSDVETLLSSSWKVYNRRQK